MKKVLFTISALLMLWSCSNEEETSVPLQPQEEQGEPQVPGNEDAEEKAPAITLTAAQKQAVENNNDFAFNFFRSVCSSAENEGKGLLVSPISLTYALGMLNMGATGQTSNEITTILGFSNEGREGINELCKKLIEQAPVVDEAVQLRLADMVVADKTVPLSSQYQQDVEQIYLAKTASLDFSSPDAVKYINDWCSQQTEGKIPSIVENLDGTLLALLNAVYFKAPWSGKFDAAETRNEQFTKEDGSQVALPMMHREGPAFYQHGNTYTTLGLPYGNGKNWTMFVLLPNEGKSIADVITSLNSNAWKENIRIAAYGGIDIDVKLPRFKAEYDVNLKQVLKQMGAPSMFEPRGELTKLTENGENLAVGDVRQKSTIEVTEDGTEAAAITVIQMSLATGDDSSFKPVFHATHPFVYLIQENTSGAIFFIGAFMG